MIHSGTRYNTVMFFLELCIKLCKPGSVLGLIIDINMTTGLLEGKAETKDEAPWKNFPDSESEDLIEEISCKFGWYDIPKSGGGDIDLWDYSLSK